MERKTRAVEMQKIFQRVLNMKTDPNDPTCMDVSFCPVDDISYHKEKEKLGVRCVRVIPYIGVQTVYLADRNYLALMDILDAKKGSYTNSIKSENVSYISDGEEKNLTIIYHTSDTESPCVLYEGTPLITANSCIITGHDFSDLTMEQCYALVTSARCGYPANSGAHVNITKNMDLVPRLIVDEE